jgi:hypothetical protein
MGRPKKTAAQKATKAPKDKKDPRIEETYEEEVTFMCPKRGLIKQKVKVKRFKPLSQQLVTHVTAPTDELDSKLDSEDDGMSIYNDGEELGITDPGGNTD